MSAYTYPCRVLAHRGGGTLAPENTLAGIREAGARGYGGVEFDVMLARDDAPVLMHDDTIDRTTSGRGAVPDHGADQLRRLDAGRWRDAKFTGEPVPGFQEAARLCLALDLFANVEIKPWGPGGASVAAATGRIVAGLTHSLWAAAPHRVLLSSFSGAALAAAQSAAPEVPRAFLFDAVPGDWQDELRRLGCVALHCNAKRLPPDLAGAIKRAGYGLMCWTVNDPADARRLFDCGVDAICTDRLDLFAGVT